MNLLHNLVGYTAATLTTLGFIPQTLKFWRTRDLSGVSSFHPGRRMQESWPIIMANTITIWRHQASNILWQPGKRELPALRRNDQRQASMPSGLQRF